MKTHYLLNDALKSSFHNGSQTETTARTTGEQLRKNDPVQLLSIYVSSKRVTKGNFEI